MRTSDLVEIVDEFAVAVDFATEAKQDTQITTLNNINAGGTQYATKVTTSGATTYVAVAVIGSAQASAVWQAKKIAVSGADTVITWAGSGAFNQVATDLTALTYA